MAALPYMKLHVSEYLADTAHLEAEEQGAYLLLILRIWQTAQPLPSDDILLARFARVSPERWPSVKNLIQHLFNTCSTEWRHARVEFELEEAEREILNKSKGGKASAAARKRKAIKDRKSSAARPAKDFNSSSTPVEQVSNKEEVKEVCSKEHTDLSAFASTPPANDLDISPDKSKRKKPTYPIPTDFTVTREMLAWVEENDYGHIPIALETDRFIDHWKSKGEARADWIATWRTWIRNADRFQREAAGNRNQRDRVAAAIHGH